MPMCLRAIAPGEETGLSQTVDYGSQAARILGGFFCDRDRDIDVNEIRFE